MHPLMGCIVLWGGCLSDTHNARWHRETASLCIQNTIDSDETVRPTGKEALALVYGVKQFHKHLVGREFTLVTDHRPLLKILGLHEGVPTLAAVQLQCCALLLSAYNYELKFKSGVDNKEADLLSRLPIPMQVIDPNEENYHVD